MTRFTLPAGQARRPSPWPPALPAFPPQPADDPAQEAELRANMAIASQLGATGTPLFVVGNRVINAAVGYDGLKEAVKAARTKG